MIFLSVIPSEDAKIQVIGEIISLLLKNIKEGKDIEINKLKNGVSSKYGIAQVSFVNMEIYIDNR